MGLERVIWLFCLAIIFFTKECVLEEGQTINLSDVFSSDSMGLLFKRFHKRFCPKYDMMVHSGLSQTEIEKALENQMKWEIHDFLSRQEAAVINRESQRGYNNFGPHGQVAVKTDDKVGQYGQLLRSVSTGSGDSSGTYSSAIVANQMNQIFSQSNVKEFYLTLEPAIGLRTKFQQPESRDFNNWQRKISKSSFTCDEMIDSTFNRLVRSKSLQEISPRLAEVLLKKFPNQLSKGLNIDGGKKPISVETQISIGSDGYSADVINMANEGATNSDNTQILDTQSHGLVKDSNIDIAKVTLQFPITLGKK